MANWKSAFIPYHTESTDEAIDILKRAGYEGVEWNLRLHIKNPSNLKPVAEKTRKRGLEVCGIMASQDLVTTDDKLRTQRVALVKECIEAARDASVGIVNVFTGPVEWVPNAAKIGRDISEDKAWSVVVDAFSSIVEAAEKNAVTVTVEAAFGMLVHDYYTMREFLENFKSPRLAVTMDPSHLALYGNDPAWAVKRLGARIKHVHVKDVFGKPGILGDSFTFPLLGDGIIDWKSFFKALSEVGYGGFLSIEYEADNYLKSIWDGDWSKAAQCSKQQLDHLTNLAVS
jgi:sugar phosphate isomerase/epimerase